MQEPVRWGILGTGDIARQFASDLNGLDDATLLAVGSRRQETADRFGDTHGIPKRYATYEALVADPEVQAVYVATPHPLHCENTLLALDAGKAVLCEKPLAMNMAEGERMMARAREKGCFLMEAMWTYFLPAIKEVEAVIASGAIGDVRMVRADFSFWADRDEDSRLFNREMGGGSLLDVGIYPIALATLLLGEDPEAILSTPDIGKSGVDEQVGMLFRYDDGRMAVLSSGIFTDGNCEAVVSGTKGHITIPSFFNATGFTVTREEGEQVETHTCERAGFGYGYEALEVHRCLREGLLESDRMPHRASRALFRIMDGMRKEWGLRYPADE
jgi:predicted dehydrogenase